MTEFAGFTLGVSCPRCGGEVDHVNSSPPMMRGTRTTAIVKCRRRQCPEWQIVVELMTCGTSCSTPRPLEEAYQ